VADNPGRKQTQIAEVLGIKRANFVAMIDRLERRTLVERRPAVDDMRANALHLTRGGKAFVARARRLHQSMEDEFVSRLGGPQARETLLSLLDRLT
jgi:DNA-binding MarR family transcriptional regulator